MHKGSLGVTFFPVCMYVRPYVRKFWEIHFFLVNYNCDATYEHLWCPNGPEVNRKWPGSDRKWTGSGSEVDWKFIFLVNYNCDASYEHLWCPNGPEVNRKWTGSDRKWSGSGPEVDWKCPSVRPYVCPSQTLPLPPWRTLCEGSTSAGRLRPAIFKYWKLDNCDWKLIWWVMMQRNCVRAELCHFITNNFNHHMSFFDYDSYDVEERDF